MTLVAEQSKPREEIVGYFGRLFRFRLKREPSPLWDILISYSCDLFPGELVEEIERAYRDGLVNFRAIPLEEVRGFLARSLEEVMRALRENGNCKMIRDTAAEMSWWASFNEKPAAKPKAGRNDRCPCGSGRKYRKCCGA
jgi:hypothetical protein